MSGCGENSGRKEGIRLRNKIVPLFTRDLSRESRKLRWKETTRARQGEAKSQEIEFRVWDTQR